MAEIKHTPGPWRVGPYYRHEVVNDHGLICCGPIETEATRANARLIAAAPELLDALKECMYEIRDSSPTKKHALEVIDRAEGR